MHGGASQPAAYVTQLVAAMPRMYRVQRTQSLDQPTAKRLA